jgi:subtilisin family serine protease
MKKIITFSLALLATMGANAQSKLSSEITDMLNSVNQQIAEAQQQNRSNSLDTSGKQSCPVDTAAIQYNMVVSFNADGTVKTVDVVATLAEGATCPTADLEAKGIKVKDQVRKFVFLTVPADQLEYLETVKEFVSLDENTVYHPMTDNTRKVVNVSNINGIDSETYTFDVPYTGKGVVIGVVDTGIDYNHIAFKDSEGKTRIKKVVHYPTSSASVLVLTDPEAIATLESDTSNDSGDPSHGTHVASCAAGSIVDATVDNALGSRKLGGMAPEADLVLCGVSSLTTDHITKSVDEITKTAKELNEPCVINFSFGTTGGWHDGNNSNNKLINEYAGEGVIFCMSTANDAYCKWNVDKTIPADGYLRFIPRKDKPIASTSKAYIPAQTITINLPQCTNKDAISWSFEVVDSITGEVTTLAQTPLKNNSGTSITPSISFSKDASHQNWVRGTLSLTKSYFDDNNKFLVVKLRNATNADLRAYAMSNLHLIEIDHKEYDVFARTDFNGYNYDKGTADISINNACSAENLISVGAYTIEPNITGYDGKEWKGGTALIVKVGAANSTAAYSCYGRDDFGKAHPDVIAPGTFLVAAYNRYDTSNATVTDKSTWIEQYICAYLTDNSGNNHLFYRNQGTSMAAPITAGVIALWLQAYPKLTAENVRTVIQQTSRTSVNGEVINISAGSTDQNKLQLGYGLIDAEAGIQYIKDHFPTAIAGVKANESSTPAIIKKFVGGAIVVEKDGKLYNASGQRVK